MGDLADHNQGAALTGQLQKLVGGKPMKFLVCSHYLTIVSARAS